MEGTTYQRVAVTRPDGGVSIVSIVIGAPTTAFDAPTAIRLGFVVSEDGERWEGGITDEGVAAELDRTLNLNSSMPWRRIGDDEMPPDRTFRAAWRHDGTAVSVNLPAAREIVRTRIRERRKDMFTTLDSALQPFVAKTLLGTIVPKDRATVAALETQRQALRDAPGNPAIDAAQTTDDLNAVLDAFG